MSCRTDLAIECLDFATEILPKGIERSVEIKKNLHITRVKITDKSVGDLVSKAVGEYTTIEECDFKTQTGNFAEIVEVVSDVLKPYIRKANSSALVIGLGNLDITPDALGPKTIGYIFATRHIDNELQRKIGIEGLVPVVAIAPGVLGQTGIETAEIVSCLVKEIKPSCVIVIDALASKSIDRLANTIQISNAGIAPGSGVQNKRKELSEATLGVPVISIGVPMVVDMDTIVKDLAGENITINPFKCGKEMMVTPREIDLAIEHAAKIIGFSINHALQPTMSIEELVALVG